MVHEFASRYPAKLNKISNQEGEGETCIKNVTLTNILHNQSPFMFGQRIQSPLVSISEGTEVPSPQFIAHLDVNGNEVELLMPILEMNDSGGVQPMESVHPKRHEIRFDEDFLRSIVGQVQIPVIRNFLRNTPELNGFMLHELKTFE